MTGDEIWVPKGKKIIRYWPQEILVDQLLPKGQSVGQVWYLIVSISDLCTLTYFKKVMLAAFFDFNGHIVQIYVPRGRTVAGLFHKR